MAKREQRRWICRRDFDYGVNMGGGRYNIGQVVAPLGLVNDHKLFMSGDATHWTAPFEGEPVRCGTDGCVAEFGNEAYLARHRLRVHAPERAERERRAALAAEQAQRAEDRGDTIGGREVVEVRSGPRGAVPYIGV